MKLSIRSIALLTILVPMLLPALGLSAWLTSLRVNDARAELESRGERELRYLADASELALLVADSETLQRLAASNLKGAGAVVAYCVVFLVLVMVLVLLAKFVATRRPIAEVQERWEHVLFPLVLIGLGVAILVEGGAFGL